MVIRQLSKLTSVNTANRDERWRLCLAKLIKIARENKELKIAKDEIKSIFGHGQSTKIQDTQVFSVRQ
jgi:hypothetical protein